MDLFLGQNLRLWAKLTVLVCTLKAYWTVGHLKHVLRVLTDFKNLKNT